MDIISITESSTLKLEYNKDNIAAQNLRKDILKTLKMCKPPKDNLSKSQRKALNEIKESNLISIYPFDKGSGFVRIKKEDAVQKIKDQIGEINTLAEDPTNSFAVKIKTTLSKLNKKNKFTKEEYEVIYPSDPIAPRMYGVIKAHKPEKNYPMRIIVSTVGTPVYGLSQYLVSIIQFSLNKCQIRLKNSVDFVEKAKQWTISKNEIQVSYDVVNLYPSVPIKDAINVVINVLHNDQDYKKYTKLSINEIKSLLELCLSRCYFLWDDKIYELENAGPIGLSLMVVMAEAFLQYIENKAIQEALNENPPIDLKSYHRYVDDSHARFPNIDQAEKFKEILNKQNKNIQYTIEHENESKTLNFLDVSIINTLKGKYDFNIHRKQAITNIQIKPTSSHNPKVLDGIFKGFIHRAFKLCSENYIEKEIEF